jgi:6-phosphogluconolactonase
MQFIKVTDSGPVVEYLAETLLSHLDKGDTVLWLVPGGSAIAVAAEVGQRLSGHDLSKLHVTLTDERYGPVGHPDSNWQQLADAGFSLPGAQLHAVLGAAGRAETAADFADYITAELQAMDFKIGLFGIGPDGHTAGVLPHSPAADATGPVADYDASNFERITITLPTISHLDEAVVYAMGQDKRPALEALATNIPLDDQPAQVLKQVPKLSIFNDQKEI